MLLREKSVDGSKTKFRSCHRISKLWFFCAFWVCVCVYLSQVLQSSCPLRRNSRVPAIPSFVLLAQYLFSVCLKKAGKLIEVVRR